MRAARRAVAVVCSALLLVPVLMKSRMNRTVPDSAAFRAVTRGNISVKVSGDVQHPGMYTVTANSLAIAVIKMAEPVHPLKRAVSGDNDCQLADGSTVTVAVLSDGSYITKVDTMAVSERLVMGIPLDISVMNEDDFDRLPGIGPALAKRIIMYRQNNGGVLRVNDLAAIEGIGEKKYKRLVPYFQHP